MCQAFISIIDVINSLLTVKISVSVIHVFQDTDNVLTHLTKYLSGTGRKAEEK
jgi:hypothetical protein